MMTQIPQRYAKALLSIAKEKEQLYLIKEELGKIKEVIYSSPFIIRAFFSPHIPREEKMAFIDNLFPAISSLSRRFIELLLIKRRETFLPLILDKFNELLLLEENKIDMELFTPLPISDKLIAKIKQKFQSKFNKEIILKIIEEPALIGGIRVRVGNELFDGSVEYQLKFLKERMIKSL